jgi:phospholipase C
MRMRMMALVVGLVLLGAAHAGETPPACPFGPGALPADTLAASQPHGDQIPVDHIVVLMQENRSFDHYLGQLARRRRGFDGPRRRASNPNPEGGPPIRRFHEHSYCEVADLDHSWNASHRQWNGGAMDGFTTTNVDPGDPTGSRTMGYYTARDLPFYYGLLRRFATADRFFCSLLGPTYPNRFYLLAGTSFGHIRNDFPSATDPFAQRSVFDLLDEAGIAWKVYYSQIAFAVLFEHVRDQDAAKLVPIDEYFADAKAGTLPPVAWVDPVFFGEVNEENDEHPPANVQVGQAFTERVVRAFMASPAWSRGVLFLTYDEHGGFWDHVPPPPACVPDDVAPNLKPGDTAAAFDRYGFRVPMVAISPFSRRRFVSHTVYDLTSVLRFVETRFDLPALTRRDANADPMLELFDFRRPRFRRPPRLPRARIDQRRRRECDALGANGAG